MNYAIDWRQTAENQLANLWMATDDPNAINEAVEFIERLLGYAPLDFGESRAGDDRLLFSGPLGVYYRVDRAAHMVTVISVGPSGRSP